MLLVKAIPCKMRKFHSMNDTFIVCVCILYAEIREEKENVFCFFFFT